MVWCGNVMVKDPKSLLYSLNLLHGSFVLSFYFSTYTSFLNLQKFSFLYSFASNFALPNNFGLITYTREGIRISALISFHTSPFFFLSLPFLPVKFPLRTDTSP